MSASLHPTVGRKVWFRPCPEQITGHGITAFNGQPLDATIICVWTDTCVNLQVTDHGGKSHFISSCQLAYPGMDLSQLRYGYAEWMPYQIGQAKKEAEPKAKIYPGGEKPEAKIVGIDGGFCFGAAIELLKNGRKVARAGWNGKGMYLWLLPAATVKAEWCKEPHLLGLAEANGGEIECLGSIRMFTADGKVLTGWLASQSDMLAEDWVLVQ